MANRTKGRHFKYESRKVRVKEVPCIRCGTPTLSGGTTAVCDMCKEEKQREKVKRMLENRCSTPKQWQYEVVYDPDKEYGYQKGATFYPLDIDTMCQANIQAFTLGTILRRHELYFKVICDRVSGKQSLIPIEQP